MIQYEISDVLFSSECNKAVWERLKELVVQGKEQIVSEN